MDQRIQVRNILHDCQITAVSRDDAQALSESMPFSISTTLGQLTLDFQRIGVALDTGQHMEYEAIEKVCLKNTGLNGMQRRTKRLQSDAVNRAPEPRRSPDETKWRSE
jgi:hypothetical protein